MRNSYSFTEHVFVDVNDHEYFVEIDGTKSLDEFDRRTWHVEFDKITITNEQDEYINSNHPDYEEIMEELENREFGSEYELEGLDGDDDLDELF
jgi:hypothetical protein